MKKRTRRLLLLSVFILLVLSITFVLSNNDNNSNENNNDEKEKDVVERVYYRPSQPATTFMGEGQLGTEESPYVIGSASDMQTLSDEVNNGNTFSGKVIVVGSGISEINLGDFTPIGTTGKPFSGTFDGSGVNFKLDINKAETDYVGLFGLVQSGTIENLSVSGNVIGRNQVGGVVGRQNTGSIVRNVYNTAYVEANNYAGGIIGYLDRGTLENSYNRGEIVATRYAGGVVGGTNAAYNSNINAIRNVYSSGFVSADLNVGGVVGIEGTASYASNTRTNLYYDVTVIANYDQPFGKLKPSAVKNTTDRSTGLNTSELFITMSTRLSDQWSFKSITNNYGYYPQLRYFSENSNSQIKARSEELNTINIVNGIGSEERPFLIREISDLNNLKRKIEDGNTFEQVYFKIADGRNTFNLENFSPIGINGKPFYGSFDGNNTQFILNRNAPTENYQGLFGRYGKGTIKNLSVSGTIKGGTNVGGIVGYLESGTVTNVYNISNISGVTAVGGIVGYQETGTTNVVYNDGDITGSGTNIGGIIGHLNRGVLQDGYNQGEIVGSSSVGGVVGRTNAAYNANINTIRRVYSAGLVSADSSVGGLVGTEGTASYASNARANYYYDVSVLVNYDQPRKLKPLTTVTGNQYTTDKLIYSSATSLGFTSSTWYFREKEGTTAYYPQLIEFASSGIVHISNDSVNSVEYDVGDGLGTKNDPFLIRTKHDMDELSRKVSEGNTYVGYHFKVDDEINEIDLTEFIPIGTESYNFRGSFDGNGVNFKVNIDNDELDYVGIFGIIQTGVIENFSVSGSVIGRNQVGGVVGRQNTGSIVRNVYNTAYVEASNYAGGIIGYLDRGTLENSYNRGEIVATRYAGGVVGGTNAAYNSNINAIRNVYSSGLVSADLNVGGVVGIEGTASYASNTRTNLYYDITVIANYAQKKAIKPSSLVSTQGISSGQMFNNMSTRLTSGLWYFRASEDGYAYYPQLLIFSNNKNDLIKTNSTNSVKVDVSDGLGTIEYPFILYNKQDLEDLKGKINSGNTFEGFYFVISDDYEEVDLGDFSPIGINGKPFYGSFDGNNTQFILNRNAPTENYQGLFGRYGKGTIKNLSVSGTIKGGTNVGGIVGYLESGTVTNVYNISNISGVTAVGGIVGYQETGTTNVVYNDGDITGSGTNIGGIIGHLNRGVLQDGYNQGEIVGSSSVGGVVGRTNAAYNANINTIRRVYSAGLVSADSSVGGLVGTEGTASYASNARANYYYDVSVLVNYDQPRKLKPLTTVTGNQYTTDKLIYSSATSLGFTSSTWYFREKEGTTAYYPQLIEFASSGIVHISNDSVNSVEYDVGDGLGTKNDPFLIRTKHDMDELSRKVSEGNTYVGYHFKVDDEINEIDLTEFIPIGTESYNFRGSFDGNGVNFKVNIDNDELDYVGIFGIIQTGVIENFSVSGSVIGRNQVGGVVGRQNTGSIVRNVYNTAYVEASNYAGGIIGYLDRGTLENSYNRGEIVATRYAGGVVGGTNAAYNSNINAIRNVYSSGLVSADLNVGGVVGIEGTASYASNTRTNLYYDITVIANYAQKKAIKPSSLVSTQGISSGQMFNNMSTRLTSGLWYFRASEDGYAYYPQLLIFSNNKNDLIKTNSTNSVKVDVSDGLGTIEYPFILYNKQDLEDLKGKINSGNTFEGFYFVISDDYEEVDLGDFSPIGINGKPFYGSFDGNNTQFILNRNAPTENYQGLFGRYGKGTIKNLSVSGTIKGGTNVGGIVGYLESGTVTNVYNISNISGVTAVGGIVGYQETGTTNVVYNDGDITGSGTNIGGIIGHLNRGVLQDGYNQGEIVGSSSVGGVVGRTNAAYNANINTIRRVYSAGLVSADSSVGGLVGTEGTASYASNARANYYYDVSVIANYNQPAGKIKPSSTVGGQGLDKVSMFENGMEARGFTQNNWEFKSIDGNYAFYPQLKVFANNENEIFVNDSITSVKTNPFMGDGTKESPYLIRNAFDMEILSKAINKDYDAFDIYYLVAAGVANIDLTTVDFVGIGNETTPFKGHFDGNFAHFIMDLSGERSYLGLFGHTSKNASIKNLSVSGDLKGLNNIGSVVGHNNGSIENVYAKVNIEGNNNVGGLVGYNTGIIANAFSTGNINATGNNVAGLIGFNNGSIENAYAGGKIHGKSNVGGLIGYSENSEFDLIYYNKTIIEYDDIIEGLIKPINSIGNMSEFDLGLEKEQMTGLDVFNEHGMNGFSSDLWTLKATNGIFDYYPQLKVFSDNTNNTVKTNSQLYSRVIRFTYGTGSKNNPYIIRNEEDMKALSDITASDNLLGIYFKVEDGVKTLDLTMEGLGFVSIGRGSGVNQQFRGGFDGNDVTIIIEDNRTTTNYVGLFGYLGVGSEVKNLTILGSISGRDRIGALAGEANGSIISNIRNNSTVNGRQYVGGLIGVITDTTIDNSYNMSNVVSTSRDIGGLVGWGQRSTINNAFNYGNITASIVVGGILGYANNNMTINNVYNRGSITSTGTGQVWTGGIIGASYNNTTLSNSYSAGAVVGRTNNRIGGIIGGVSGTTHESNSYYDKTIIEAQLLASNQVAPTQAIFNKLNQEDVKGVEKTLLTGNNAKINTNLSPDDFVFIPTDGAETYYPQLKVFESHYSDYVKEDSLESVKSYVFVGEGTVDNPYIIVTSFDMENLSNLVSSGLTFEGDFFKVKDDVAEIDLTYGINYKPIGNNTNNFEGYFDGTGTNFILNLNSSNEYQGLFGVVGRFSTIKNLSVSGNILGNNYTASIAGFNKGNLENIYTTASVNGNNYVGSIAGYNEGIIDNTYTVGKVLGNEYVGGLVGYNNAQLTSSYSSAEVFGKTSIGGAVGYSQGIEEYVYYNTSLIEVSSNNNNLNKPFMAVSNKASTDYVTGVTTNDLYSGFVELSTLNWKFETSTGFYAYYPQLNVFANSKYKTISSSSRDSVTVNKFNEGNGSEEFPYIIRNEHDMEALSQMLVARYTLAEMYFKVADDVELIDLTKLRTPYVPIGNNSYRFQGSFDGNGVVFNIDIDRTNTSYQGVFGVVGDNGYLSDFGVTGSIKAYDFAGGIAGRNYGTILRVYNLANVESSRQYAGGITGWNDGLIDTAYNTGTITATTRYSGGISGGVARNKEIHNTYNTGNVITLGTNSNSTEAGGLVGYLAGIITNSYSSGGVAGRVNYLGGLIGRIDGQVTVENSYYVLESIYNFETTLRKPTTAISNSTISGATSIYKNQITSDQIFDVELDKELYILKQSEEFKSFFPQLRDFQTSNKSLVKEHSLLSVTNELFYGTGDESTPFKIYSSYDLRALGLVIKQGYNNNNNYFVVEDNANINFEHIKDNYIPIGTVSNPFEGNFNGNNKLINVAINNENDNYQGIFGYTGNESVISNINATGYVNGRNYTGLLIGYNLGQVNNVILDDSNVTGHDYVGTLAGYSENNLENLSAKGQVTGNSNVGGLIGKANQTNIELSYFMGDIIANSNHVGGLIGNASNTNASYLFAYGNLLANNSDYVGGLFGEFSGIINNSYAVTNIKGNDYVAGIVGLNNGEVNEVFYSGNMTSNTERVAGVTVINNGKVTSAYYNKTEINNMRNIGSKYKPETAIYNEEDTYEYGSRFLEDMTVYYAIGDAESQMNFDGSLYNLKEGTDFTSFFPELYTYIDFENETFNKDSLKSITYKKIEGEGTSKDPYIIYDGYDMMTIYEYVSNGNEFIGKYFKVADGVDIIDLTIKDINYRPIGTDYYNFNGIFNGNAATFIIELDSVESYQGIFHTLGHSANVYNLTINGMVKGRGYIGSLAGRNLGTISNITNYASVTSHNDSEGGNDTGGIVGYNAGSITNVTNNGVVNSNSSYIGGIAGQSTGEIKDAYNRAPITGFGNVGGVVGMNNGTIRNAYNIAAIRATESVVGGIAGTTNSNIYYSFNSGSITADKSVAAGIVGVLNSARIEGVYNGGKIIARNTQAAGIVAYFNGGTLIDSYHFGSVLSEDDIGIIVAHYLSGTITRTFYDTDKLSLYKEESTYKKPTQAVGNKEDQTATALFHGQMLGTIAISKNNLNLYYVNNYKMIGSEGESSFYPQIIYFANSNNEQVKNDSLESVRTNTFIVGEGTNNNPYFIRNESDWLLLADSTSNGNDYNNQYFVVNNEIDELNFYDSEDNYQLLPVGTSNNPFNGILDGKGINFRVNSNNINHYQALFGYVGINGKVSNLSLSGSIRGGNYTAGIAAINEGLIESVYNQANITGSTHTAGIVSVNKGILRNSYNRGKVVGTNFVGGIAAYLEGDLYNTYNTGVIYGRNTIGAIIGHYENGMLSNSYYDRTILNSYRDVGVNIKPEGAVGTSYNGENVNALDKRFMVGENSIGTGALNINFIDDLTLWTTRNNIEDSNNYPQLAVFSKDNRISIRTNSNESTRTTLLTITFDDRNETETNYLTKVISPNEHYNLRIPEYFGYDFLGWYYLDGESEVQITNSNGDSLRIYNYDEDITVYAKWKETYHLIEFVDGNNKVISTTEVRHGLYLSNPVGVIPTKNTDSKFVYKFLSWDFDFDNTQILKPYKVKAIYENIDRYYEITYLDGNGDIFEVAIGEYEKYLTMTSKIPTKKYHDDVAYKFIDWDFNFNQIITNEVTISPNFEAVDRYYTIKFYNEDVLVHTSIAEYLFEATLPEEMPKKESTVEFDYTFVGWDKDVYRITSDLDVNASYKETLRKYIVVFYDGDDVIYSSQEVEYGSSAATPVGEPKKTYHDDIAYKFINWINDYSKVTGPLFVYPEFEVVDRYYTVIFEDAYGKEIDRQERIEYLSSAETPDFIPEQESSDQYIYEFDKWDQDYSKVTANLTIKPLFNEILRSYMVYFMIDEDNLYDTQSVYYGTNASVPFGTPYKQGTNEKGYKFISWQTNYVNITGDTYVYANYQDVVPGVYTVTFMDGDLILKTEQVLYAKAATAPIVDYDNHPTEGYEYYFISWSGTFDFVESDITIKLNKGTRLKEFDVTIINGDETIIEKVEWGKNVILPEGFKTSTEQIRYIFTGWDNDGLNIRENRTITALFDEDFNYFEVRFYDGNENIIKIEKVYPGQDATPPVIAIKDKTDDKVFIFNGWDKDYTAVESDLLVYAKFVEKDRYYTVVFEDAYGETLSEQTVEYGDEALLPMDPEKVVEGRHYYIFTGWDQDVSFIDKDIIAKPTFTALVKMFDVAFYDGNGDLIKIEKVAYGLNALAPNEAFKEPTDAIYYLFEGKWDTDYTNVTDNLEINALFTSVNRWYNVIFYDEDGITVLDEQVIEYGSDAIDPRPKLGFEIIDDNYVKAIIGWNNSLLNIKENRELVAIYDTVDRYYDVTFYDYDGTIIKEHFDVHYGSSLDAPIDPVRPDEEDYFYQFNGWDKEFNFITSNLEIFATYIKLNKEFKVTFIDGDGNIFSEQIVKYGENAINPGIPGKTPTDEISYIFTGWNQEFINVTENLVINSNFDATARMYLVIFEDEDGTILKEEMVRKGSSATPPEVPSKPSTNKYDYVVKWSESFNNIQSDKLIVLSYEAVERIYTATFYDDNNNVIHTVTGTYEQYITAPVGPLKPTTAQYYFEFEKWSPDFNEIITENISYYPIYIRHDRYYTVTFLDGDGNIFDEQLVRWNEMPVRPEGTPTKTETQQFIYTFRAWETINIRVHQDLTIRAVFYEQLQQYKVSFIDEYGNLIENPQMVNYGSGAIEPISDRIPHKPSTHTHEYAFGGWIGDFSYITEDTVIQIYYIGTLRKFTYTFYMDDETTIIKHIVGSYGDRIVPPTKIPTKEGTEMFNYIFDGWNVPVPDELTENHRFVAVFKEVLKTFTVKFFDGNGELFHIEEVGYGNNVLIPSGIPSKEQTAKYQFEFSKWLLNNEEFNFDTPITNNIELNADFESVLRRFTVTFIINEIEQGFVYLEKEVEFGSNGRIADPYINGYNFIGWDKDLRSIESDLVVTASLTPRVYNIIFKDGYVEGEIMEVHGEMKPILAAFDEEITLKATGYTREGYVFIGWYIGENKYDILNDKATFSIKERIDDEIYGDVVLTAYWILENYYIDYYLDGGEAFNPNIYTVEDEIKLQDAYKDGYEFEGWYMVEPAMRTIMLPFSEPEEIRIEVIERGTIGDITLIARYKYAGYIQLKEESMLGMYHAEIATTIPIEEREAYNDDNPVYLLGVFLGQTLENLRENFINNDLIFVDSNQNILEDTQVVATGYQILVYDSDNNVIDRVHIVLKGDTNGDGRITAVDFNSISNHLNNSNMLIASRLLAIDLNNDGRITAVDFNILSNQLNNSSLIHDPNITSTLRGD